MAFAMLTTTVWGYIPNYYTEDEYNEAKSNTINEAYGVIVENNSMLGYLIYRNADGATKTANYYRDSLEVEKQPYYESIDRIGYIDELFPSFQFDARDTTIDTIKAGDSVYMRFNSLGEVTYISAYNDYIMRYGKVVNFDTQAVDLYGYLTIQDEKGEQYTYNVPLLTPISKKTSSYTLGSLKVGEWVKLLVVQRLFGEGIIEEEVLEIVVDDDYKTITGIYRGELLQIDNYKNLLRLKNTQLLKKSGWSAYSDITNLNLDTKTLAAYYLGNQISVDYMTRALRNTEGYVYAALENYMGKDSAVKLNFQSKKQTTLPTTQIIYSAPGIIRLLTGETIYVAEDAIVVRDKRLIDGNAIMVGDTVQVILTGADKAAIINVLPDQTQTSLQIFRGRIKKVQDREQFEVETFSILEDYTWYYHPTPRTFNIDAYTKFYKGEGLVENGVNSFLSYGETTEVGNVYTLAVVGDQVTYLTDMPYTKEAIVGTIYESDATGFKLQDVQYYDTTYKRWLTWSKKNVGVKVELPDNSMVVKGGTIVKKTALEEGDKVIVMLDDALITTSTDTQTQPSVKGYIVSVQ
jgi:hypothetical protein